MPCSRCGRDVDLMSGPDGSLYCGDCIHHAARPECRQCDKCFKQVCGVYACPLCSHSSGAPDASVFDRQLRAQPIAVDERCERCGTTIHGSVFILHGKAMCKECLVYEQDRWEIVPAKPDKGGVRVRIIMGKPKSPGNVEPDMERRMAKRLFHSIGIDPADAPKDPLVAIQAMEEGRMPDDACASCEDEIKGKRRRKLVLGLGDSRFSVPARSTDTSPGSKKD